MGNKRVFGLFLAMLAVLAVFSAGSWYFLFGERGERVDLAGVAPESAPGRPDERPVLRVAAAAMISPASTRHYYNEIIKLIGDKVGRRVVFIQRRTYAEVNDLVERKEVDLAFVCSGPYVTGHKHFGMELLAVPLSRGKPVYYSYIIVPVGSTAASLDDLRGGSFAFTDPHSNSGCMVPRYMLAKKGETAESFFKETFFTNSHDNSIKAVAEGQADGAAVDSLIYDFLLHSGSPFAAKTKIIVTSVPYGIPPVVVHPDLDPELKKELREAMLSLDDDARAKPLLERLQIDGFTPGDDRMYDSVREMNDWFEKKGRDN